MTSCNNIHYIEQHLLYQYWRKEEKKSKERQVGFSNGRHNHICFPIVSYHIICFPIVSYHIISYHIVPYPIMILERLWFSYHFNIFWITQGISTLAESYTPLHQIIWQPALFFGILHEASIEGPYSIIFWPPTPEMTQCRGEILRIPMIHAKFEYLLPRHM